MEMTRQVISLQPVFRCSELAPGCRMPPGLDYGEVNRERLHKCVSVFTFAWSSAIIALLSSSPSPPPLLLLTDKEVGEEAPLLLLLRRRRSSATCKARRTLVMKAAAQRKCHIKCFLK